MSNEKNPSSPMVQEGLREALKQAVLWAQDDKCSYPADAEKFEQRIEILRAALSATPAQEGERIDAKQADTLHRAQLASFDSIATPAPPVDETDRLAVLRRAVEAWAETDFFGEYDEDGKLIRYSEERAVAFAASEGGDVQMAVQATFAALAALADRTQEGEVRRG